MAPDLTDPEVDAICAGLVQNHAKVKFLQGLGLTVRRKPNGRPLVNRSHYDAVLGCTQRTNHGTAAAGPVWDVH
jgi:hypothetical protein